MTKTIAILGGALAAAAVAIGLVFMVFAKLAEQEFVAGDPVYLRDVYIVIDQTLSMESNQRREAKNVAMEEVVNVLGVGDRAFCYRIGDDYQETNDRVFSSPRNLPRIWSNVAQAELATLPSDMQTQLGSAWTRFENQRGIWRERLDSLDSPRNRFSDYLGTIADIGQRINDESDPSLAAEKWLVVIGDLKHEPVPDEPPSPTSEQRRQFSDVQIFLVHPGSLFDEQEQRRIENFWERYFADRGNPRINILSFDGFIGRFPTTSVPRVGGPSL